MGLFLWDWHILTPFGRAHQSPLLRLRPSPQTMRATMTLWTVAKLLKIRGKIDVSPLNCHGFWKQ